MWKGAKQKVSQASNSNRGRFPVQTRRLALCCGHSGRTGGNLLLCRRPYCRPVGPDGIALHWKVSSFVGKLAPPSKRIKFLPLLPFFSVHSHTMRNVNDWTIQLGITRRHSHTYYGQRVKVKTVIPHPLYNLYIPHDNDIALFQV